MIILFGEGARVAQHDTIKRGMMKLAAAPAAASAAAIASVSMFLCSAAAAIASVSMFLCLKKEDPHLRQCDDAKRKNSLGKISLFFLPKGRIA